MYVSFFTTVIVFEPEVTECQRAHRSAQPSADGPHDVPFLSTRVGTTPAAAAIHSTPMDPVQPATPQTPTTPALEPLPPMGMTALYSTIALAAPSTTSPD